ncbi:MAG: hypothetical protein HC814_03235 [Rhodobacteraceae bacterium]|nr:hypothetical protein [Paracoccaceae bacterium]
MRGDSYHGSNFTFRRAGYRAPSATPSRSVSGQRLAVEDITCRFRGSYLDDGSKVLILRNVRPYSVDFHLKCYTRRGQSKTLVVSLAANSSTEIGFLEGWEGNFVTGERCEAYLEGNLVWTLMLPEKSGRAIVSGVSCPYSAPLETPGRMQECWQTLRPVRLAGGEAARRAAPPRGRCFRGTRRWNLCRWCRRRE